MKTYYTKCGRVFEKSTNADTTGYQLPEDGFGNIIDDQCEMCPFIVDVKEGYGEKETHKRFECRAGSQPPNHENTFRGSVEDKNTLSIKSLDHDFCESVIDYANTHPKLSASYNQDCGDCRRTVSVACSQNKKGMVAKQELIDKFFPKLEDEMNNKIDTEETVFDQQTCRVCGCTNDNACPGGCHWVEDDLCSKCAEESETEETEETDDTDSFSSEFDSMLGDMEDPLEEETDHEMYVSICPFCTSSLPVQLDIAADETADLELYAMKNCTCEEAQAWRQENQSKEERERFENRVEGILQDVTGMTGIEEAFDAIKLLCLKVYDAELEGLTVNLDYCTKLTVKNKNGSLDIERTDTHKQKRSA